MVSTRRLLRSNGPALAIAGVTAFIFWPAVSFDWLRYWDDGAHLIWNEGYKGLSPTHLSWMSRPFIGQWMPLTWLSWAIDFKLWGLDPSAYHRTNVLLHALNAGLLFLVARRLLHSTWGALAAALLWALHPMRVESVAWVNERRDVLSGLFYLLAILTYLKGVMPHFPGTESTREHPDTGGRIRLTNTRWLVVSVICFALAVLSKALAVSLPIVLLLLDYYPLRRRAFLEKLPYVAISVVGTVMAFAAILPMQVVAPLEWISLDDRLLLTAYSLWFYPLTTLWPSGLSPMYELTFLPRWTEWRYLGAVLGVGICSAIAIRGRRRWPAWSVAWAAYVVTVLPVSGLFQNGYQLVALRYGYLATLPLILLVGAGADGLWRRPWWPARLLPGAAGGALGVLAMLTTAFLPVYRTDTVLWTRAIEYDPGCVMCANYLVHGGDLRVALTVLAGVVAAHPEIQEQRFQLGMVAYIRARGPEGEAHFREYLRLAEARAPGYIRRIEVERQQHMAMARSVLTGRRPDGRIFDGELRGFERVR